MVDIIFHIGLPKTATTTLQEQVFPLHNGFVGVSKRGECLSENGKRGMAYELLTRAVFQGAKGQRDRVKELVTELESLHKRIKGDSSAPLLFSVEGVSRNWAGLSGYPVGEGLRRADEKTPRGLPPVIDFLKDFDKVWGSGRVRVLFTIRSQPLWLASLYSQLSGRIYGASQRNFEEQMLSAAAEGNSYLHWSSWVDEIKQVVGSDHLCVLPIEEIGTLEYWKRLSEFVEFQGKSAEELMACSGNIQNKRNKGSAAWEIRPWKPRYLSYRVKTTTSLSTFPWVRNTGIHLAKRMDKFVDPFISLFDRRVRGQRIELTDEIRGRISDHVAASNRKLAGELGKDLGALGYPV